MQRDGTISKEARATPFTLVVSFPLGTTGADAKGKVYVDEDERPEMELVDGEATYVEFYAKFGEGKVTVWSEVKMGRYSLEEGLMIEKVSVLGLQGSGAGVEIEVEGEPLSDTSRVHFSNENSNEGNVEKVEGGNKRKSMVVEVGGLELPLGKNFSMTWKMGIEG
nr:unnamed protein product [Ananas comosus var. bracteatus]